MFKIELKQFVKKLTVGVFLNVQCTPTLPTWKREERQAVAEKKVRTFWKERQRGKESGKETCNQSLLEHGSYFCR